MQLPIPSNRRTTCNASKSSPKSSRTVRSPCRSRWPTERPATDRTSTRAPSWSCTPRLKTSSPSSTPSSGSVPAASTTSRRSSGRSRTVSRPGRSCARTTSNPTTASSASTSRRSGAPRLASSRSPKTPASLPDQQHHPIPPLTLRRHLLPQGTPLGQGRFICEAVVLFNDRKNSLEAIHRVFPL